MKTIKNTEQHDLEIPYEGTTYILPMDRVVSVPEKVHAFCEEHFPLAFNFRPKVEKDQEVKEAEQVQTHSFFKEKTEATTSYADEDMRVTKTKPASTFGADELPAGTDKDGVDWYGDGVQVEGA